MNFAYHMKLFCLRVARFWTIWFQIYMWYIFSLFDPDVDNNKVGWH